MRKNKKAMTISLRFLIGIILSIMLIAIPLNIYAKYTRLHDTSKESFYDLVRKIEEVNGDHAGTVKHLGDLRMDEETIIVGFSKNNEPPTPIGDGRLLKYQKGNLYFSNNLFNQLTDYDDEKYKSRICLCRELEGGQDEGKCKDNSLICETFDELEFSGWFILSRSKWFMIENYYLQFKVVHVEKYNEYGEELVAVCENLEGGSCVSQEYREEKKAIHSPNNFKNFIELCKDREFVNAEEPEPCGCGAFNFKSFIPEGYGIRFSKSDNDKLNITSKHETQELSSIEVDTGFCIYKPHLPGSYSLSSKDEEEPTLEHREAYKIVPNIYTFYYGNNQEDIQITFVKNSDGNICLLKSFERGYIGLYADSPDTITFKSTIKKIKGATTGHSEINITGCKYPTTDTEEWR